MRNAKVGSFRPLSLSLDLSFFRTTITGFENSDDEATRNYELEINHLLYNNNNNISRTTSSNYYFSHTVRGQVVRINICTWYITRIDRYISRTHTQPQQIQLSNPSCTAVAAAAAAAAATAVMIVVVVFRCSLGALYRHDRRRTTARLSVLIYIYACTHSRYIYNPRPPPYTCVYISVNIYICIYI